MELKHVRYKPLYGTETVVFKPLFGTETLKYRLFFRTLEETWKMNDKGVQSAIAWSSH